jgi:hypothetical protein
MPSAPFAVEVATAAEVESWPAWYWSGVDFGAQQSVDNHSGSYGINLYDRAMSRGSQMP